MLVNIHRTLRAFLSAIPFSGRLFEHRHFSLSFLSLSNQRYRPPSRGHKFITPSNGEAEDQEVTSEDEKVLDMLLDKTFLRKGSGHQVLVIQPYIKWGVQKKRNTTPQLQMLEAVTLIKTLRRWKVIDQVVVSLQWIRKDFVFGSGVLENLRNKVVTNQKISAVFISVNALSLLQQKNLEKVFGVPVFDRFTIIMFIFQEHAQTREAKLQVEMAQLPYLKTVLRGFNEGLAAKYGDVEDSLGGKGPQWMSVRKEVFRLKKAKIKREIESLREQRQMSRKQKEKQEIPVVAVIGYTNAGKTSIIKALTGKKCLEPQDYLFATLDVTSHLGELPCGMKAYFVDTLGFISDIPTYLIESFVSTLEDAVHAQVIIHVRDISHPDTVAQNDIVINTLKGLNLSEEAVENIITVGNKVDLVEREDWKKHRNLILVSSTELIGVDVLRQEIQKKVLKVCDKIEMVIRVETGSEEYFWLHDWTVIVKETPDPKNHQFMLTQVIISKVNLAKFKHHFIKNFKRTQLS